MSNNSQKNILKLNQIDKCQNAKFMFLFLIFFNFFALPVLNQQLLAGIPIDFSLGGTTTYTPTSGGVSIPGYILNIGFNKFQWIGLKFMSLTSQLNYDVLIIQRSTTPNGGNYECTIKDYYVSSGRQGALMGDSINNMDQVVKSYSSSNNFKIQLPRTLGNTNGQDWQSSGANGDFVEICFFTSDLTFSLSTWSEKYKSCYGYSLQNYVSTWVGYQIGSNFIIDGVGNSKIYGGIDGPLLQMNLFFYRQNPTLSNTQVIIRLGKQIDSVVGYDYQRCVTNPGDYYGFSISSLKSDLIYSGFNDQNCQIVTSANSFKLFFKRYLSTYDSFDQTLFSSNQICLIFGTTQTCYMLSTRAIFPIMSVNSALAVSQLSLKANVFFMLILIFLLFIKD